MKYLLKKINTVGRKSPNAPLSHEKHMHQPKTMHRFKYTDYILQEKLLVCNGRAVDFQDGMVSHLAFIKILTSNCQMLE